MKEMIAPSDARRLFPGFPVVIASVGSKEEHNLITLAMVHVFSFSPPYIGVGIAPERHSYTIIKKGDGFVLNIPGFDLIEAVNGIGGISGRKVDKFAEFGLTRVESTMGPPRIEECQAWIDCRTVNEIALGDHTWFVGEVVEAWADPDLALEETVYYWNRAYRRIGGIVRKR